MESPDIDIARDRTIMSITGNVDNQKFKMAEKVGVERGGERQTDRESERDREREKKASSGWCRRKERQRKGG